MHKVFYVLILFIILQSHSLSYSADSIPPLPCDYYGTEESPGTLNKYSRIVAKDPNGVTIGEFTLTENAKSRKIVLGHYRFLRSGF